MARQATADWNSAVAEKNERLNDYILALHVYNAHQQRHRDVDQPKMAAVRRGDELLVQTRPVNLICDVAGCVVT